MLDRFLARKELMPTSRRDAGNKSRKRVGKLDQGEEGKVKAESR